MVIELQHHFLPFQSFSSSSVTKMEFRQSVLDDPPPPPPPLPPQLWLQRSSSELPGMEFHHSVSPQSPAPPPPPPPLWLQRHPPPPGCNDSLVMTNDNPEIQRNADKVKEGRLIWRRKKSSSPAESSADISDTKMEALSPAIGKKAWRCSICQVRTTSEAELKHHFQGKKHMSMEAVLKPEGNGSTVELGVPHEPRVEEHISRSEPLLQTLSPVIPTKCSDENCTPMSSKKKIKPKRKKKEDFAFWCEVCKVGTDHESVLNSHMNGKKHLSQLQKETANVFPVIPIQKEVKAETVSENHSEAEKQFGTADTDKVGAEVSQPLFSESPALTQRVFVQGTGVAPISGRTGAVCSLHVHRTCRCRRNTFPAEELFVAALCIFCVAVVLHSLNF